MSLTEQDILRYARHIIMPEVGGRGQKRIKAASVLVAGLGAAGSAAALYLAAAGVGRLTLWDPAELTEADLTQAIAHARSSLGQSRAASARGKLLAINPDAAVAASADPDALPDLVAGHQVVVATAGDWESVQSAVLQAGASAVFAGVQGAAGAAFAHRPGTACLGCIPAEERDRAGLRPEGEGCAVAAAGGVVGTVAATEALKLILDIGSPLTDRLWAYDGWTARFRETGVSRRPDCPLCGGA